MKREDMVGVYRAARRRGRRCRGQDHPLGQQQQFADHVQPPTAMSAWSATPSGRKPLAELRRPHRSRRRDAGGAGRGDALGLTCYAGHFEVKDDEVHHHIEMALNPNLIGTRR